MRFSLGIIATLTLTLSLQLSAQDSQQVYTLEECIDYAVKNNQTLQNAKLEIDKSDAVVKQQLSQGLPQVDANVDLGYNFKVPTTFIQDFISPSIYGVLFQEGLLTPVDLGEPATFPAQFGTKYSGSASISLEQMIFNGSYFVGLKAARTFTDLSRKEQVRTQIDVIEAVSKAYYTVLVNQERQELVARNFSRIDSLLANTQALYENGFAEKIDVSRIKVQHNNLKVEVDNISKLVELSYLLLKFQMGMPAAEELAITEKIEDIIFSQADASISEGFSYDQRIEYSAMQTQRALVDLDIKNTRVQYLPKVDLYGSIGSSTGTQSLSDLFNFGDQWFGLGVVGLRMNVPIFDGTYKAKLIEEKRLRGLQIDNSFKQLETSIDLQIQQSQIEYDRSVDNLSAQQENMTLAEEVYNVAKLKYEEGVGSSIEVTNSDADLKEAQTNYYNAVYDALIAKVELEKAYGKLLENN